MQLYLKMSLHSVLNYSEYWDVLPLHLLLRVHLSLLSCSFSFPSLLSCLSLSLSSLSLLFHYSSLNNNLSSSESVLSQVLARGPPVFAGKKSTFCNSLALAQGKKGAAMWLKGRLP